MNQYTDFDLFIQSTWCFTISYYYNNYNNILLPSVELAYSSQDLSGPKEWRQNCARKKINLPGRKEEIWRLPLKAFFSYD